MTSVTIKHRVSPIRKPHFLNHLKFAYLDYFLGGEGDGVLPLQRVQEVLGQLLDLHQRRPPVAVDLHVVAPLHVEPHPQRQSFFNGGQFFNIT